MSFPYNRIVIHDWMVQCQLAIRDHLVDSLHLIFRNEALFVCEVSPEAHAGGDSVAMEHACWQFITRAPGVAISMRAALVSLPQIAILGAHVSIHGFAHNEVTLVLESTVGKRIAHCSELGFDKLGPPLLQKCEEGAVFNDGHLDDLGNAMAEPSAMERPPQATVCYGENWRMVGAIKVLVVKAIAAGPWRWAGIDTRDDRSTQHDVRCVPRIQR